MWPESVASRESQEIGSCLLKFMKERETIANHLIVYSDDCGGQNHNINIAYFWMYIVTNSEFKYTIVDHKFMISSHSYLPNDWDFGSIERANLKTEYVFVPEDWYTLVQSARRKNPIEVIKMTEKDFVSISNIKKEITYWKVNTDKENINWLNIHWLRLNKDSPFQMLYHHSHNSLEPWKTLDIRRKRNGRPSDIGKVSLVQLYSIPCPINVK